MSLRARIAAPFRVSWPVLRRLLADMALFVPSYAFVGLALLWAAARLLVGSWGDAGGIAVVGGWSLTGLYALLGAAGGAIAGAVEGCARTLAHVERHAEAWILDLPTDFARDLLPSVTVDELEGSRDTSLRRVADATVGRLPMPRLVRRLARERLRRALLDDFLATCRARGVSVVGHGELRNWLLARGLSRAIEPARAQLRVWRAATLGGLGLAVLIAVATAALGGVAQPAAVALGVFALAGAAILVWGLPRASLRERPARWRMGVAILAVCTAGWPVVYARLWREDLGLAWAAVLAITFMTIRRGFEEAFVRAGPARDVGSTGPAEPGPAAGPR